MASVTIKGLDKLTSRLNKISDMDLTKAINKATALVHGQAKLNAPVDTGTLRGSIHMNVQRNGKNIQGRVYTNVEYAPFVEFGTGIRGNGSYPYKVKNLKLQYKDDWQGMVAQPYMYPALKEHEKEIKDILGNGVKTVLKGKGD